MADSFKVVSLSYKKASLEIREQIALSEAETKAFYLKLKDVFELQECLVLSTCNRTEIYYKSEENKSLALLKTLALHKGISSDGLENYCDFINEEQTAIEYLFEVALGLQSQVVGDLQIPNQIKLAYQWSADMQMAGPFMHRLLHTIFYANKRIVQETGFRDGAASTSYVTVDLMESFLPMLSNPKILVLGLGDIGEDVTKTIFEKGYKNITICNRTLEKAQTLAPNYNAKVLNFEVLSESISSYDVVISSIRAEKAIIDSNLLKTKKRNSILYLFDLSVPRSIQVEVEQLPGVVLYGLDEIQKRTNEALNKRSEAIPAVKAIIQEMVYEVENWAKELLVSPTIQKLKNALELIRKEEMARYTKTMSEEEVEKMEKITASMMQKIIKLPVLQLKAACKRGQADTLIDVLNDLFDLERVSDKAL
jgi:glutamyl-tRNA reductase